MDHLNKDGKPYTYRAFIGEYHSDEAKERTGNKLPHVLRRLKRENVTDFQAVDLCGDLYVYFERP